MTNNLLHNLDRLQHDQQTENQRLRNKVATLQTENETLQAAVQFEQNQKAKAREQRDAVAKQLTEATQRIAELEQERDEYKSLFLSEFNND